MPPTAEDVLTAALGLPDDDRFQLVEALIASFEPPDRAPFDDSWRDIVRRRSAELRSGQVTAIPWEDIKRQARESSGGHPTRLNRPARTSPPADPPA
jgi:putative addiction module component (TIGR02574 family)